MRALMARFTIWGFATTVKGIVRLQASTERPGTRKVKPRGEGRKRRNLTAAKNLLRREPHHARLVERRRNIRRVLPLLMDGVSESDMDAVL
jgi:hypothetical protein